jgi:Pyruvate/2-oxoacid:ferredoxin oxidoreductase gamma subunit
MIGSPVVDNPDYLIVMNGPSLDRFEDSVVSGGAIYINTSLIKNKPHREDVKVFDVPATELAGEADFIKGANIIMLTILCLTSGVIKLDTLKKIIPLSLKRKEFVDINMKMVEIAGDYYEKNL